MDENEIERLQEENEKLQRALDKQRADNHNLRQENIGLRAEVRTFKELAQMNNGLGDRIVDTIRQMATEIENLKSARNRAANIIWNTLNVTKRMYEQESEAVEKWFKLFTEVNAERPLPQLASVNYRAAEDTLVNKTEGLNRGMERGLQVLGLQDANWQERLDPYEHPEVCLAAILGYVDTAATLGLIVQTTARAYGFAHDPRMVADEIFREWKVNEGVVDMRTASRLTLEWIKTNMPDPPAKYETLCEGLRCLVTRDASERALRKYQSWLDVLQSEASKSPDMPI